MSFIRALGDYLVYRNMMLLGLVSGKLELSILLYVCGELLRNGRLWLMATDGVLFAVLKGRVRQ
jgi:hypothetical protein